MLKCIFLIPIGSSVSGKLLPRFLELQTWCNQNNSQILTITGRPHNFARNFLATGGKGFTNPGPPDAEWLFWLDADIVFTIEQIEDMLNIPDEHKFCAGWYRSNNTDQAMCGLWDVDFFNKNGRIPFVAGEWLESEAKKDPSKHVKLDYTGFGFVKMHRSIIEKMTYPYFTLNIQELGGYRDLSSEDVSFCLNCIKETGIHPCIFPRFRVGHLKETVL